MRVFARPGLLVLGASASLLSIVVAATAQTAKPPAAGGSAPKPTATGGGASATADQLNQTLATVNGETVTRGELVNFLSRYQLPAGNDQAIYSDAVNTLINLKLINQFLARQRVPVAKEKIDEAVATTEKQLKQDGTDLATEMLRSHMSMEDIRNVYADRLRWIEYLNIKATDAELKKYAENHKDLFSNTQVRASHILLKVEPTATAADKEAIRAKLAGIKKEIEAKKMTFAEAANKYSEDPGNAEGAGGDVGFFGLNSGFIEEFSQAAFTLKPNTISDPVETNYGYHLIMVTERREGKPLDFEQNKPFVKQMYGAELQKTILTAERKKAQIEIKPMPAGLFPPAPTVPPATTAPATAKPATGGAQPKAAARP